MSTEGDFAAQVAARATTLNGSPVQLELGASLRTGMVREPDEDQTIPGAVPHLCVFVTEIPSLAPIRFIDGGERTKLPRPEIQITIRSLPEDYDGGKALADFLHEDLDMRDFTGYCEVLIDGSSPTHVPPEDPTQHHLWLITAQLWKET